VARGIFGLKKEEVTGACSKFHSEELKYYTIISRRMRWEGHVAH
jgi:hypothetical protein